jgi:hypothetical protein
MGCQRQLTIQNNYQSLLNGQSRNSQPSCKKCMQNGACKRGQVEACKVGNPALATLPSKWPNFTHGLKVNFQDAPPRQKSHVVVLPV